MVSEKPIVIDGVDASILFFVITSPQGTKTRFRRLQSLIKNDHVRNLCRAIWGFKSTPYFIELAKINIAWGKKYCKECRDFYRKRV